MKVSAEAHLGFDIVKRRRADDRETNQEYICLGVRQRAKSVIVLLTCSIPKTKADGFAVYHNTCRIVVKTRKNLLDAKSGSHERCLVNIHSRDIFARKCVGGVGNQ